MKQFDVAVVGATGLVGRKMVQVLAERAFPLGTLRLLATKKSVGKVMQCGDRTVRVEELTPGSFKGIQIALFSGGAAVSKEFAPLAVKAGAVVIDNSSAFRLDENVPLVVPEVNPREIAHHRGIISNPNCSTIQMVVALKPLHDRWRIRRIVVATYQAVTGAGQKGVDQLESEIAGDEDVRRKFPHTIAYNVIPQIDVFLDNGSSREEHKMVHETKKILGDDTIKVTATCARVPSLGGHSEAVNVEFEKHFELEDVRETLRHAPGVCLQDDIQQNVYPMPIWAYDKDEVFVGRIRRDETVEHGLNLWIVSDSLRKGAATNAVQIAEELIKEHEK
ncbi:MAG: aspartate-semialdehyde dehydrogenase [Bacteroidota bacterium]|jgi:aspartate-semialdehyde dehydrogenase